MEIYLIVGLLVGMVMVGVYWGLPPHVTGPKSVGKVLLILVTAPFLWPIQITYYAVRLMTK